MIPGLRVRRPGIVAPRGGEDESGGVLRARGPEKLRYEDSKMPEYSDNEVLGLVCGNLDGVEKHKIRVEELMAQPDISLFYELAKAGGKIILVP